MKVKIAGLKKARVFEGRGVVYTCKDYALMNEPGQKDQEPLETLLRQWTVEAELPPRFHEQVWQRIARSEARRPSPFRAGLMRLLGVVSPQPKAACACVAALLVLSIAAGSWTAQVESSHLQATLGLRYVQSIDPYQTGNPQP